MPENNNKTIQMYGLNIAITEPRDVTLNWDHLDGLAKAIDSQIRIKVDAKNTRWSRRAQAIRRRLRGALCH